MAFNGSGVFVRLYNWANDKAANIKVRADRMDSEMDGFATGLSGCITKDGQTTVTANLPMANYRHTGVANGTARNDYAALGQAQDRVLNWVVAGGTVDAITASCSPAITALAEGQEICVRTSGTNTSTTPTLAVNAIPAKTIVKNGGSALVAGDIPKEAIFRYDLTNTRFELVNASPSAYMPKSGGTFTSQIDFSGTTHAGLKLNSLTTTQRDALTPAAGMAIFNSTTGQAETCDGLAWRVNTGGDAWLSTQTASSSSALTFTGLSSAYGLYVFEGRGLVPATDDVYAIMEYSADGGSTWFTTSYLNQNYQVKGSSTINQTTPTDAGIYIVPNSAGFRVDSGGTNDGLNFTLKLQNPSGSNYKYSRGEASWLEAAGSAIVIGQFTGVYRGGTSAINAVRFRFNNGNIVSGSISMYGVRTA